MRADGYSLDDKYGKVEYEPTEVIVGKMEQIELEIQAEFADWKNCWGCRETNPKLQFRRHWMRHSRCLIVSCNNISDRSDRLWRD